MATSNSMDITLFVGKCSSMTRSPRCEGVRMRPGRDGDRLCSQIDAAPYERSPRAGRLPHPAQVHPVGTIELKIPKVTARWAYFPT